MATTRPARGIPTRRKALFAVLALLLLYSGYAWYAGLAFTAGLPAEQLDWDGDGTATTREQLQAWYAVTVRTTREGPRECHSFYWRGEEDGSPIRVDCRTTFSESSDSEPSD